MKNLLTLAFGFWSMATVWAQDTINFQRYLDGHTAAVEVVEISNSGLMLASGGFDNNVRLYSRKDSVSPFEFERLFTGHYGGITSIAISNNGQYLVSASKDYTFRVYEIKSGSLKFTSRDHAQPVTQVQFDPQDSFILTSSTDKSIKIFKITDVLKAKSAPITVNHSEAINGFVLSPRKGHFILATNNTQVVELSAKGKVNSIFLGHSGRVNCIDISHNRKFIATGSDDKTIRIFNIATKQTLFTLEGHGWKVTSVEFSADDRYLLSTCNNGEVKVWNVQTGLEVSNIPPMGSNARQAQWLPDMTALAVASHQKGPFYGVALYKTPYTVFVKKPAAAKGAKPGAAKPGTPAAKPGATKPAAAKPAGARPAGAAAAKPAASKK
jgi:WD40 repeat protein